MICSVGPDADGKYKVSVTLPGDEKPQVFTDIEYRKGFETVAGNAKKRVAFYIDNLTIRQREDRNKTTE